LDELAKAKTCVEEVEPFNDVIPLPAHVLVVISPPVVIERHPVEPSVGNATVPDAVRFAFALVVAVNPVPTTA
jgi:hypothetical protein